MKKRFATPFAGKTTDMGRRNLTEVHPALCTNQHGIAASGGGCVMAYRKPQAVAKLAVEAGTYKAGLPLGSMLLLGFLGGAFIALGYLLDIRVTAVLANDLGSFGAFLGAAVFPLGLILVVLAGGELLTGNMMAVSFAYFAKKVTLNRLAKNWLWITISNLIGAIFVAYVFGHLAGLLNEGVYLEKTVAFAHAKVDHSFSEMFFSAIGCNWLVGLAIWLSYGASDMGGKILAIWFPIMGFVGIGFQHVVANMFLLPVAIFAGEMGWGEFIRNFIPVYLGNAVGGSVFVGLFYWIAYKKYVLAAEAAEEQAAPQFARRKAR